VSFSIEISSHGAPSLIIPNPSLLLAVYVYGTEKIREEIQNPPHFKSTPRAMAATHLWKHAQLFHLIVPWESCPRNMDR